MKKIKIKTSVKPTSNGHVRVTTKVSNGNSSKTKTRTF